MTFDEFRSLLKATPFRPFRVKYKTGDVYTIAKPDDAWVPPSQCPSRIYTADAHLDPSWITAIEFIDPPEATHRRKAG